MLKVLVVYFSATGVTKSLAEKIAKFANADIYEIKPVEPYTDDDLNWHDPRSRSSIEMNKYPDLRPKILGRIENISQYDRLIIGFPIWWYAAPKIVNSFLESYDFVEKKIAVFATSAESDMGGIIEDLKLSAPKAFFIGQKRFGKDALLSEIKEWVKGLD